MVITRLVTLPLASIVVQTSGDQVCLGDLALGGNSVCCLIIIVIFIELGRAHRLEGGYFEVIIWMGCHIRMGPFLWGKLTPEDTM